MHDKMDHATTTSLVFSHKTKQLDGLMKLPVSIFGMLAHGHGDVRYAYYGLDIFAQSTLQRLFDGSRSSPLFEAVLSGAEMCESALPPLSEIPSAATPLPPILNV
jgi:hypothetical protein